MNGALAFEALDGLIDRTGLDLASELFHRINSVIPENQTVLSVEPQCKVRDAIALMERHGFSQLPVVDADQVLGVFSYRSFARQVASATTRDLKQQKEAIGDLLVDDFLEAFRFARLTEELDDHFDAMERDNGLLVGSPERLIGILTPMDLLKYLYKVASPFVLISEIELSLRAIIELALGNDGVAARAERLLRGAYGDREPPKALREMTFDNYVVLVSFADGWPALQPIFGPDRNLVGGRLRRIGELRNDVFHFRREITTRDISFLTTQRNWFLTKVKQAHVLIDGRAAS